MTASSFWSETLDLLRDGGPLMVVLAALALLIYYVVFSLYFDLRRRRFGQADPNVWQHWVDVPAEGQGELGDVIRFAARHPGLKEMRGALAEIRTDYLPSVDTRLRYAMILVSAAPLTGLLGTVIGMLKTFDGLSLSAGTSTATLVAGGIAEALITTQTDLVIAIPGLICIARIRAMREDLDLFFIRLENALVRRLIPRRAPASAR
jgi:biopolymer transport protein ExbB